MNADRRRLAIIGGGPRAVFALECLARRQRSGAAIPAEIDVFEPRASLGTGSAYELDQPDWIRLNLPIHVVDAGAISPDAGQTRSALTEDMMTWSGRDASSNEDVYPPRSEAGRYLVGLARSCIESLRPATVGHLRHPVSAVERSGRGFAVTTEAGAAHYDEVLLVTGHASCWDGRLKADAGEGHVVPALPIAGLIDIANRRRPRRAYIRGASLTAIDAILALSEGLGGDFAPAEPSGTVTYAPGALDVPLTVLSRSGRLMAAKTESRVLRRYRTAEVAAPHLAEFERSDRPDVGLLVRTVAAALHRAADLAWSFDGVDHALSIEHALAGVVGAATSDAREGFERSLRMARGLERPDATWALGQAWRCCYPTLVRHQRRLSRTTLAATLDWPDYAVVAPELERLAFGPPPVNADKLLALMAADRLSVRRLTPEMHERLGAGDEFVVDAVSAPPGIEHIEDAIWKHLLGCGLVVRAPYGRGILVDEAAGCLDAEGRLVPGLSAVGRMTEDVVLGNDTLSRTMHTELEHWAARLCREQELVA